MSVIDAADSTAVAPRRRDRHWPPLLPLAIVAALVLCALFAPLLTPHSPLQGSLGERLAPPIGMEGAKPGHPLGTDRHGRDTLSRLLYGARISLSVSVVGITLTGALGAFVGLLAGFVCFWSTQFIKRTLKIDDSLDVFPVHGVGGFLGLLLTAVFANRLGGQGFLNESITGSGAQFVEQRDLEEAIDRVMLGLEKKSRCMTPDDVRRVACHESGHALVALSVEHADPVHRVSIIPRSIGALGHMLQLPTQERYLLTRPQLEDRIAVMLGGRGAEAAVYQGVVSTGASDDLQRAGDALMFTSSLSFLVSEDETVADLVKDEGPTPEEVAVSRAEAESIRTAVYRIAPSEAWAEAFIAYHEGQASLADIASAYNLGVSRARIGELMNTLAERVRKALGNDEESNR